MAEGLGQEGSAAMSTNGGLDVSKVMREVWASKSVKWLASLLVFLWLVFALVPSLLGIKPEKSGTWGDTFGALNTLFSGLAFFGVAIAVALEHEELKATKEQLAIAREEARSGDEARKKSDEIIARQAEALLAAARMNAAGLMAHVPARDVIVGMTDNVYGIARQRVYEQYIRIILNSLVGEEPDSPIALARDATIFRKYLVRITREALLAVEAPLIAAPGQVWVATSYVKEEVDVLAAQPGIPGSRDWQVICAAFRLLAPFKDSPLACDAEAYKTKARSALKTILENATSTLP